MFSPNFADDSISFHIAPKGIPHEVPEGIDCIFGIQVYKIPKDIQKVNATIELTSHLAVNADDLNVLFSRNVDCAIHDGGIVRLEHGLTQNILKREIALKNSIKHTQLWTFYVTEIVVVQ